MRTIGLLGGMSWESSILYEQLINTEVRRRLGGLHSADLLIRSYDFARVEALQAAGAWDEAGALLAGDARRLQDAGAELLVLCTNTMHRVADAVLAAGLDTVALLGTRFTMEDDFYVARLAGRGLDVVVPDAAGRDLVHRVIYAELVRGVVRDASRTAFLEVIDGLLAREAQGVIAGCTEIELLVTPDDVSCPYFPTTRLHALAAVDAALATPTTVETSSH